ncbi:MAG: TonB-dependent receptor [Pseudomonadota bacterium]
MLKSILGVTSALVPLASLAAAQPSADPGDDTIVVTASPLEKSVNDVTVPVSVLEGDELQRQLRGTLGETLAREPGISSTGFGAGASRPIIRGLGGDRVRTLTNGIGTIDAAAASPDHATPIEPALVERIEIVRGPQVLRYGSSAAGGVVNVIDGRILSETPEDGVNLAARTAYTTVDQGTEASIGGAFVIGEMSGVDVILTASYGYRDADDYDIPGFAESAALRAMEEEEEGEEHGDEEEARDTLENSFVEVDTYSGGLSFVGDRGFLGFSVQRFESVYGLPGGHEHGHEEEHEGEEHDEEEEEEGGAFLDLEQTRFDVNGSLETDGFIKRFNLFAGYADYEHIEFEGPGEAGTVFANEGFEGRFEFVQRQVGNWQGASGIQYRTREFSAIGEEAFVTPTDKDQIGLFTFQEWDFGGGTFEAAGRYESTELSNDTFGIDRSFDTFSGSLAASLRASEQLTLVGNVYRNERAPTTEELFSDGPHLATASFDIGDTDLDVETALGLELGARADWGRVRASLTGFITDYSDFIYQVDTGLTGADILMMRGEDDEEELEEFGELAVLEYVAADATFQGFELDVEADLGEANGVTFTGDLVIDYVDASLTDADRTGSDNLARIPPLGVVVGFDADAAYGHFRAEVEHAAEADQTATFELPTDSFTLVNLYAEWYVVDNLTFEVSALNLTDEEARLHTSFIKDVVPLPGRNFRFALRYSF